jgi:hypothetical protein
MSRSGPESGRLVLRVDQKSGLFGTIVVFFIFLVFPCFILLFFLVICALFHICMFLMELSLLIKNMNLLTSVKF